MVGAARAAMAANRRRLPTPPRTYAFSLCVSLFTRALGRVVWGVRGYQPIQCRRLPPLFQCGTLQPAGLPFLSLLLAFSFVFLPLPPGAIPTGVTTAACGIQLRRAPWLCAHFLSGQTTFVTPAYRRYFGMATASAFGECVYTHGWQRSYGVHDKGGHSRSAHHAFYFVAWHVLLYLPAGAFRFGRTRLYKMLPQRWMDLHFTRIFVPILGYSLPSA